ncbi:hypothetical protein Oweho_3204 [Owenweeksia hongkongensis DSM 17368]|uniref:Uncharacterized protein n=1 Tax=Owenweeksia hongkongensis (strain DSM 17368 / CIP 108786 / JCM 12287 / NRRL B-23963 / UST20020801) TaxID=926562 RepID=G8R3R8_OWEHD|nr:hypothetical protein [Owenweeksia hongkongensis]AEV34155.1 hypothetical protein Oweho_3204 [Owenweeksia hongkongensis DSM 17368]
MAESLENINPELIKQYIESGSNEGLTQDQAFYLQVLKQVQQLMTGQCNDEPGKKSKKFIVKYLVNAYPGEISEYQAGNFYADAINFFYIVKDVKLEAWGNYYADELHQLYLATINSATCIKDYETAHKILLSEMDARTKYRPQESKFPEELFKRPVKVYTQDPRLLSQDKVNRRDLAKIIDDWEFVTEADKKRIKVDAGIEAPELILNTYNETDKGK